MRTSRWFLVAGVLAALVVAAGCGDDAPEATTTPPAAATAEAERSPVRAAATEPVEATATPIATPVATAVIATPTTEARVTTTPPAVEATVTATPPPGPAAPCLDHDELTRCWLIHVPDELTSPVPLVLDFHGWTSSAGRQRSSSGFKELADERGFIVVWPEGYLRSWNAGATCCLPASGLRIDDVGFMRALVGRLSEEHDIDLDRVYATGLSNGCAMAQRLAADASDVMAAVACMSHFLLVAPDVGYRAVSVMELHGTSDVVVSYGPGLFGGAAENLERWRSLNNCAGEAVESWRSGESVAETYQDCEGRVEVSLVTVSDGLHGLYSPFGTDIDTTGLAWEFMSRFTNEQ